MLVGRRRSADDQASSAEEEEVEVETRVLKYHAEGDKRRTTHMLCTDRGSSVYTLLAGSAGSAEEVVVEELAESREEEESRICLFSALSCCCCTVVVQHRRRHVFCVQRLSQRLDFLAFRSVRTVWRQTKLALSIDRLKK